MGGNAVIKSLTAHISEIDDIEEAVKQIKTQLDLENNLLNNSVGILSCHYEFIYSGATKAICEALPFDVIGTISTVQGVNENSGSLLFTLMVLTSDDASFNTVLTDSLKGNPLDSITKAYNEITSIKEESPSLIMPYAPFIVENSGDDYISTLGEISNGVPCFGTFAIDGTDSFEHCFLVYNGEHYSDRMAMLLIYGDINPKFLIATISPEKIIDKPALVTKSNNHILMEVNERPVLDYFKDLGLITAVESQYAMASIPFLLDYNDGTPPVSKVFIFLTPENYAVCAGKMPEGSTMNLGVFDKEDVLFTTGEAIEKVLSVDLSDASCVFCYSCVSRSMSLLGDQFAEIDMVRELIGDTRNMMMAYSGGEICPTQISSSKAINRFHNNAFIACVF